MDTSSKGMVQVSETTYRIVETNQFYQVVRLLDDRVVGAFRYETGLELTHAGIPVQSSYPPCSATNLPNDAPEVLMEAQTNIERTVEPTGCCPPFDAAPWQDQEITWKDEPFVQDHVRSVLHVPLRFGKHVTKNQALIEAAGAVPAVPLMLSDEKSAWGSDLYIRVTKPVPGALMTTLSGTFLTRVYEGPYRDAPKWAADMQSFVAARGKKLEKLYFAYTTCPACAKAYGKNYVVLFARVE